MRYSKLVKNIFQAGTDISFTETNSLTSKLDATSTNEEDIEVAQDGLSETRAAYSLRNDAIEAVMSVNPILRAVHSATIASPIEQ